MKISIIVRKNHTQWGGDMAVINQFVDGLHAIDIPVDIESDKIIASNEKIFILTNTCLDQRVISKALLDRGLKYFILPFHEDFRHYYPSSMGAFEAVKSIINEQAYLGMKIGIEDVERCPELLFHTQVNLPSTGVINSEVIERALLTFPSSVQESSTIIRDSPRAKTFVVRCPTSISDRFKGNMEDDFMRTYGIGKGYMLQVGRLEYRKNQLFTAIASRDIPVPLVFIATKGYHPEYAELLTKVIIKYRKYPTYIISEEMGDADMGVLQIRQMKGRKKLTWSELESAYRHAAVNVHPAFYELPGLTYIESIGLKIKTICSNNAAINEYLVDGKQSHGTYFIDPTNLLQIREALVDALYGNEDFNAKLISSDSASYSRQIAAEIFKKL